MPAPPNRHPPSFNMQAASPAPVQTTTEKRTSIHLEWEDWLPYFEESSLPPEELKEQILTLWSMMLAFADWGYRFHNPEAAESCGQVTDLTALLAAAVVESTNAEDSREDV
ncbi:MAG: hypothetical protein AAGG09_00630 [Pseudomonadota bacterium]